MLASFDIGKKNFSFYVEEFDSALFNKLKLFLKKTVTILMVPVQMTLPLF